MRTQLDCIPCFIRQALDAAREVARDESVIEESLREVLAAAASFDFRLSPPEMGQIIHRIIRERTGHPDPYREIKRRSTAWALRQVGELGGKVGGAADPFAAVVRLAIAGNIMDFAVTANWDDGKLGRTLASAADQPLDCGMIGKLAGAIAAAGTVLVLGDNAGETVFDRVLIENFPGSPAVFYAVKGAPVINDATLDDAVQAGLDRVATLITNGTDAPGTVLPQVSDEFRTLFDTADVVIAKGQANFETLNTAGREIYFLTQMKCAVICRRYGYQPGDWFVGTTRSLRAQGKVEGAGQ